MGRVSLFDSKFILTDAAYGGTGPVIVSPGDDSFEWLSYQLNLSPK